MHKLTSQDLLFNMKEYIAVGALKVKGYHPDVRITVHSMRDIYEFCEENDLNPETVITMNAYKERYGRYPARCAVAPHAKRTKKNITGPP